MNSNFLLQGLENNELCPDLAIATDDVAKITSREVDKQLGGSDHKPIVLTIERNLPTSKLWFF